MSVDEKGHLVEALYDYNYQDDTTTVYISAGDRYTLLEKTNNEWWQVTKQGEVNSFYVPASYVRIILGDNDTAIYSNIENYARQPVDGATHPSEPGEGGANQQERSEVGLPNESVPNEVAEYANLADFRERIGLPSLAFIDNTAPTEYANLPLAGDADWGLPPTPAEGDLGRQLVEFLPWFIYNEGGISRPFYINKDTGERTFKPPRHKNQKLAEGVSPTNTKVNFDLACGLPPSTSPGIHPEYLEVEEDNTVVYVHKKTKERYEKNINKSGVEYFYNAKTGQSMWELPSLNPHIHNGDRVDENRNRQQTQSLRNSKAKSMVYSSDFMTGEPTKASTLPPSFSYGSRLTTLNETESPRPTSPISTSPSSTFPVTRVETNDITQRVRSTSPTIRFDEPLCGMLNKSKIADVGRRIKKNWSQSYTILHGSNLILYKDQKSSAQKPGCLHGKPESVVSLLGAKVDYNYSSDVSSKKNVITLTANNGTQYLLQADDESYIKKWLFRLKIVSDDIMDKRGTDERRKTHYSSDEKSMLRSQSLDEASSGSDRHMAFNSTYSRIREKLLSLISRRSTQEDLIKRGIIRESVFGSNLQDLCSREHNAVPIFVTRCIAAVEHKGLEQDGLYRISGNLAEIQKLRYLVDREETYRLDDENCDIHVLSGALKLFFRELKEPLFPSSMFNRFSDAIKKEKNSHKLQAFKELIADLPRCNYDTMDALFQHLKKVIDHSHENRMQTQNVAIVFGPTLMWSDNETGGMAMMTIIQSKVVEYVLLEFHQLFR